MGHGQVLATWLWEVPGTCKWAWVWVTPRPPRTGETGTESLPWQNEVSKGWDPRKYPKRDLGKMGHRWSSELKLPNFLRGNVSCSGKPRVGICCTRFLRNPGCNTCLFYFFFCSGFGLKYLNPIRDITSFGGGEGAGQYNKSSLRGCTL